LTALKADSFVHYKEKVEGIKTRLRGPKFQEHYNQAILFYNSLSAPEQLHLINAAIFELGHVDDVGVRQRMIDRFNVVDHQLAVVVAKGVGINPPAAAGPKKNHGQASPAISQLNTAMNSISTRKVAILAADGFDQAQLAAVFVSLKSYGAIPMVVSTRKGTIFSSSYKQGANEEKKVDETEAMDFSNVVANWSIFTARSVLFDATVIIGGVQSVTTLSMFGEAMGWVCETFKHHKAILALGEGVQLLQAANLPTLSTVKIATSKDQQPVVSQGVITSLGFQASPLPSQQKAKGGITATITSVASAAASAAKEALGAASAPKEEPYTPNTAVGAFIEAMKGHRDWSRDVTKVPA